MKTLDRYIVRSYLTTVLLFFLVFMSLRIVVDLFVNMDEFAELATKGKGMAFSEILGVIIQYYAANSLVYFIELGGIIVIASASFTLARFNHTNELTAMLASGVSLYRVVWPIIISAMLMAALIVVDQELIIPIPAVRDVLVRSRDDPFSEKALNVELMTDSNQSTWYAKEYDAPTEIMFKPAVLLRGDSLRGEAMITGATARPDSFQGMSGWTFEGRPPDPSRVDAKEEIGDWAWLAWVGVVENLPSTKLVYTSISPGQIVATKLRDPAYAGVDPRLVGEVNDPPTIGDSKARMTLKADRLVLGTAGPGDRAREATLHNPIFTFRDDNGRIMGIFTAPTATWVASDSAPGWAFPEGQARLFYPCDISARDVRLRRSSRWMNYMSTSELTELLEMKRVPDQGAAVLTKYIRITEPINSFIMLLLGVPFILSRERNIKASAGLCLLSVMGFYASIHICRNISLAPALSAWLPLLVFGPLAAASFDSIKT